MSPEELERVFPSLTTEGYEITSPEDRGYNCIAWAADVNHQFWWPDPNLQYYWPATVPRICTIDAFIEAYRSIGYEQCSSGDYEEGFEKIAIYLDPSGTPTHACRQLQKGVWTSKLGRSHDISHTLNGLIGTAYGSPAVFMKRGKVIVF